MPTLKWSIVKSVPSYSNISKKILLYYHEKLEIVPEMKIPPRFMVLLLINQELNKIK